MVVEGPHRGKAGDAPERSAGEKRINSQLSQISASLLQLWFGFGFENWQPFVKFTGAAEDLREPKGLKNNKGGALTGFDFKTDYKILGIKTVWYWYKYKEINGAEYSPGINAHKNGQLIFDKMQRQFNREKMVFSSNGVGTFGHHMQRKWALIHTSHYVRNLIQSGS